MGEKLLKLSDEESFEVRQVLEASIRREKAALESVGEFPAMNGPGGVVERAEHSINVLMAVLHKLP